MTTGSYWEDFVYAQAPLASLERRDASIVFGWLREHLPVGQSKIDWTKVQGGHAHWRVDDDNQLTDMAIQQIRNRMQPDSVVEHVGDGLSHTGVRFGLADATAVVGALLEIPEHHYFVADDRSWIVVVTTEGDLDFLDRRAEEL